MISALCDPDFWCADHACLGHGLTELTASSERLRRAHRVELVIGGDVVGVAIELVDGVTA